MYLQKAADSRELSISVDGFLRQCNMSVCS